ARTTTRTGSSCPWTRPWRCSRDRPQDHLARPARPRVGEPAAGRRGRPGRRGHVVTAELHAAIAVTDAALEAHQRGDRQLAASLADLSMGLLAEHEKSDPAEG